MKKILFGVLLILISASINAQNVQTENATSDISCDGTALLIDSLQYETWAWMYEDSSTIIQQNGSAIVGLCVGNYVLQVTSNGNTSFYAFTISSDTVNCSGFDAVVQITDATTYISGCNGSLSLTINNATAPLYVNNYLLTSNTYETLNLCPGNFSIYVIDDKGCDTMINYTIAWIGDSSEVPPLINAQAYTTNISAEGSCDGTVFLSIDGGVLPLAFYDMYGTQIDQYQTGLCEGVYAVFIMDNAGQIDTLNYFIASPLNIIDNTPFPDSLVIDTLMNDVLQNCTIDFATLDTAFITNIEYITMDSVLITWTILDGYGTIAFVEPYSLDAGFGVYEVIFQIFCPQSATQKYLIVHEQFKISGSFLDITETKTPVYFSMYPNPVNDILTIQLENNTPSTIFISDGWGKLVFEEDYQSSPIQINTSELAKGHYFVTLKNEKLTTTNILMK